MTILGEDIAVTSSCPGSASGGSKPTGVRGAFQQVTRDSRTLSLVGTFLTTLAVFGIFLIQGILVARILGATGRGEFGTSLFFSRDILLYAGLLGAVEIVTGYAAKQRCDSVLLKYSAARLGLVTGTITGVVAALLSLAVLIPAGKQYLIPYCLLCCLFVPWEHMQLTISSVDRGTESFHRYNINRLVYALAFPVLVAVAWLLDLESLTGISWLLLMCILFVVARVVGLLPTLRGMKLFSGAERRAILGRLKKDDKQGIPGTGLLLKEGRPYAVSMFVSELFERLDIFLVLAVASVIDSGYYFVAIPAAAMLTIAPNALGVFTFNAGAREPGSVTRSLAVKVLLATAIFQIIATIVFSLFIKDLIILFYTDEFSPAVPFALWLLPASAIKGFLQAADGFLKGRGKPMIGVRARALSILVMLVFSGVTFQWFGLMSIPMAACVGQAFSMVIIVTGVLITVPSESHESKGGLA